VAELMWPNPSATPNGIPKKFRYCRPTSAPVIDKISDKEHYLSIHLARGPATFHLMSGVKQENTYLKRLVGQIMHKRFRIQNFLRIPAIVTTHSDPPRKSLEKSVLWLSQTHFPCHARPASDRFFCK
jgi:hypothetical protein